MYVRPAPITRLLLRFVERLAPTGGREGGQRHQEHDALLFRSFEVCPCGRRTARPSHARGRCYRPGSAFENLRVSESPGWMPVYGTVGSRFRPFDSSMTHHLLHPRMLVRTFSRAVSPGPSSGTSNDCCRRQGQERSSRSDLTLHDDRGG